MLTAEHEQAEALRRVRLKACAPQRAGGLDLRWLFKLLGWRALGENPARPCAETTRSVTLTHLALDARTHKATALQVGQFPRSRLAPAVILFLGKHCAPH